VADRGLLIDWGGVLTNSLFDSFTVWFRSIGLTEEDVRSVFRNRPAARDALIAMETGEMDESEFEVIFARSLELESHEGVVDGLMAKLAPDTEMQRAVERARAAGVRTGLISNSWGTHRYGEEMLSRLFDITVISGVEGVRKPSPRIYEIAIERMAMPPSECIFVDDLEMNLGPAKELGMATVLHRSAQQTIPELEQFLDVSLS
jgi:putative hydrolase of the HAD superfamily